MQQTEALTLLATTYALSHGLLYLPATTPQPPIPSAAIHAPLALFPSPFPKELFYLAQRLQSTYNVLYARIAMDEEFLDRVMGGVDGVGKVDEFTGQLWKGWKALRDEQLSTLPLQLGLFRSDYLLNAPDEDTPVSLKQVEFNTISASFGALSERSAALHRYLCASNGYFNRSPYLSAANFPPNNTTAGLVEGLAAAHTAYGVKKHSIHIIRQTFDELTSSATVDPQARKLTVTTSQPHEISVVYYRAGYTPVDYTLPTHWDTRFLLERSIAIKCPSIPLQLAGGKKVQQVLTQPGILESFLSNERKWGDAKVFTSEEVAEVRGTWMEMWGLDSDDASQQPPGEEKGGEPVGVTKARQNALSLVLKPQREGGGNNVYKESIPEFLNTLPSSEREAWIAMELIHPPSGVGNYLVRSGGEPVKAEVISELGIFGWALFGGGDGGELAVKEEKAAGWLVRTKGKDSNEGGVATGFSVLDSVVLVD